MWKYPDNTFRQRPPSKVESGGYIVKFNTLSREEQDGLGYNEVVPVRREQFTAYETEWVKDSGLIYREEVVSSVVDEEALAESEAAAIRAERDARLAASDWTQLADAPISSDDRGGWTAYRQALRDMPQQSGFPLSVAWPEVAA